MFSERFRTARFVTASALVAVFAAPSAVMAETGADHLVSPSALNQAAVSASAQRAQNLASLDAFFGSARARQAMESAHMNPAQVAKGVASLSDTELAQLAQRANKAQADFAAGYIGDHDLLLILIAIAALVLIIIAVR
jgi:hypothetical protein